MVRHPGCSQLESERGPIHLHLLFLDGIYVSRNDRPPGFQRVRAPDRAELDEPVQLISRRVGRCLERQGLLEQDAESAWLELDPAEDTDAMPQILGSSVSYRIAVGPQQGRKAFMIRTIRPLDRPDPGLARVAKANGFSLHAGASCEGHQRDKRERLLLSVNETPVDDVLGDARLPEIQEARLNDEKIEPSENGTYDLPITVSTIFFGLTLKDLEIIACLMIVIGFLLRLSWLSKFWERLLGIDDAGQ
jgi:hypothetical protein